MKIWKITLVVAGVLVLAGCGNKTAKDSSLEKGAKEATSQNEEKGGGMISSIKDAMKMGKAMKCTYKVGNGGGGMEMVAYIDGDKYKSEVNVGGKIQHMVFDEKIMYSWSEGEKKGMKMSNDCFADEETENLSKTESENVSDAGVSGEMDPFEGATDVKCEETNAVDFSLPAGMEFEDQCAIMKGLSNSLPQGMMEEMPATLPGEME